MTASLGPGVGGGSDLGAPLLADAWGESPAVRATTISAQTTTNARLSNAETKQLPPERNASGRRSQLPDPEPRAGYQSDGRRVKLAAVLVVPSLDLSGGRAVRLVQGDFGRETTYARSAAEVLNLARRFASAGAGRFHVVDLDAARGSGDNRRLVERLVREAGLEVQAAGGIRSTADASRWLEAGAAAVVMGTVAVREPTRLAEAANAHPGRVLAALDVRLGRPAVSGWLEAEELALAGLLQRWGNLPLAGVIVTSVDRDGTLAGPDLDLLREAQAASPHPVTYSGGVRSLEDLRAVAAAGAAAVILGRSLLDGLIPLSEALGLSFPL